MRRLRKEERAGGGRIHVVEEAALCAPRRWIFLTFTVPFSALFLPISYPVALVLYDWTLSSDAQREPSA